MITLTKSVRAALASGDAFDALDAELAEDERDELLALLEIHALHTAPIEDLHGAVTFQHHPKVSALKGALEARLILRLDAVAGAPSDPDDRTSEEIVGAFRRLAAEDLVPDVYDWLAEQATWPELVHFLALEGGPDGGFDDLVAMCQVGIDGLPKLVLAANYWDEMGRGRAADVHTELHRTLTSSLRLPQLRRDELSLEVLERSALNGLLATNRSLQPEMVGALGLLELQAGPRCRRVLVALQRLDAPSDALPFYEEHATADPRHGKEWLDGAVGPLVERWPHWGPRILRGASWRSSVNRSLFAALGRQCRTEVEIAA